ncbi:hypothetical protein FA95DRAFT_1584333 [Auriscalpium vulgare]|uniref:Uncharacterized protein n=1 Tax=Auriscalpium vulgare TaxID=40419 RepID=A0ACB8REV7_9AGAM|nr:hypothetical protein FA95DRAFT_1584333 [Auriscalpium vulgare]
MSRRRPLLGVDTASISPQGSYTRKSYGATENFGLSSSPETYRQSKVLANVPEDGPVDLAAELDEEYLEEHGLYTGTYRRLVLLHTIVPATSLLLWLFLVLLPTLVWHTAPSPPPFSELLLAASLWALSHLLSEPIFSLSAALVPSAPATILSTATHVLLRTALRIAAFPLLSLRIALTHPSATFHDAVFRRVWWLALGWSAAEVSVGVAQGYEQLALYRDVLVPEGEVRALLHMRRKPHSASASPRRGGPSYTVSDEQLRESLSRGEDWGRQGVERRPSDADVRLEVDQDLDQLIALKAREELEDLYGFPAIRIPVFVSCLLRFASILLSLGFTLLLSGSYLSVPLSLSSIPPSKTNGPFYITFALVYALQLLLSLLHTPLFLSRIGVHVVAYVGLLVGLGSVFAGLGVWDALA